MKLTTKGRFAVTAMVDIAMRARESDAPVPIAQVAERQKISLAYLEQIFCRLRRAGLVESTRGPAGGYKLSEPASQITIDRIVLAVDENMDTTQCRGEGTCLGGAACSRITSGKSSIPLLRASWRAVRSNVSLRSMRRVKPQRLTAALP